MKKITLYPYQKEAKDDIVSALKQNGRSLMVMATGLGKTEVAFGVIQEFLAQKKLSKSILFLGHTREIVDQIRERAEDAFKPEEATRLYDKEKYANSYLVVATFQKMKSHLRNRRYPMDTFDYVVVDEAHHAQADTFNEVLDKLTYQWILGMTATPDRMDGKDIREIFGNPAVTINLSMAIANGWLTPATIKIRSCQITSEQIASLRQETDISRLTRADLEKRIFVRNKIDEECRMMQEEVGYEQALVFCSSVDQAKEVRRRLPNAEVIASENDEYDWNFNRDVLKGFKAGEIQFLISVNKLNEGVDIPHVKYGFILRYTESPVVFWQQLGRILRKHPEKQFAVLVDFVGNFEKLRYIQSLQEAIDYKIQRQKKPRVHVDTPIEFQWSEEVKQLDDLLNQAKDPSFSYAEDVQEQEDDTSIVDVSASEESGVVEVKELEEVAFYEDFDTIWNRWHEIFKARYPDIPHTVTGYEQCREYDPYLPPWYYVKRWFDIKWSQFAFYNDINQILNVWNAVYQFQYPDIPQTQQGYEQCRYFDPALPPSNKIKQWFDVTWEQFRDCPFQEAAEFIPPDNFQLGITQKWPPAVAIVYPGLFKYQSGWWDFLRENPEIENTKKAYRYYHKSLGLPQWGDLKKECTIKHWAEFAFVHEYDVIWLMWHQIFKEHYPYIPCTIAGYEKCRRIEPSLPPWKNPPKWKKRAREWFQTERQELSCQTWADFQKYFTFEMIAQAWAYLCFKKDIQNTRQNYLTYSHLDPCLPDMERIPGYIRKSTDGVIIVSTDNLWFDVDEILDSWRSERVNHTEL